MITQDEFKKIALAFPDANEQPHFTIPSFRVNNKIFATLWEKENKAMLRLTPVQQSVYCSLDNTIFSPVNGSWGKQGATFVELTKVKKKVLQEALALAYNGIVQTGIKKNK